MQNIGLFARAWDECVELQVRTKSLWEGAVLQQLQALDRLEIGILGGEKLLGGAILAHDPWDGHVGPCMSVFAQYVLPEYRNQGISPRLMRICLREARLQGVSCLAFTHRKGPWKYETVYRKLK